jgi:DNA polymerase-3 subunit chi
MTNIDFYLLPEPSIINCGKYICQLAEKEYKNKQRVYVYAESIKIAHYFDNLLWTFSNENFVPHNIYEDYPASQAPIQIGCTANPIGHNDTVINLTENLLSLPLDIQKVLEIIPNDESLRALGRKKYKFYKLNGYNINVHE